MNRLEKQETVDKLRSDLEPGGHLILAEYRGLTVEQLSDFRRKVRSVSGTVRVMKNTLVRRALEGTEKDVLNDLLSGPNALVFTKEDPVLMIKAVADAAKGLEAVRLKGGVVEGKSMTAEDILRIAELPSREILLARTLSTLASPMQGLVNVFQGTLRGLVYALEAIREAKAAGA